MKLKPCPFCNSTNVYFEFCERCIKCRICDTLGPFVADDEHDDVLENIEKIAIKKWNIRKI